MKYINIISRTKH